MLTARFNRALSDNLTAYQHPAVIIVAPVVVGRSRRYYGRDSASQWLHVWQKVGMADEIERFPVSSGDAGTDSHTTYPSAVNGHQVPCSAMTVVRRSRQNVMPADTGCAEMRGVRGTGDSGPAITGGGSEADVVRAADKPAAGGGIWRCAGDLW